MSKTKYVIRNLEDKDLDQIQQIDFLTWLSVQWNKSFHREDCFVAVADDGIVLGISALAYDGTWYYLDSDRKDIDKYLCQITLEMSEAYESEVEVKDALLWALKNRLREQKKKYQDKTLAIRTWCDSDDINEQQFYLRHGFGEDTIKWILKYNLSKEIKEYDIPDNIVIEEHSFEGDGMKRYSTANGLGYGVPDSEDEMWFKLQGGDTNVYVAKDGDTIVSSTTIWKINDERYATENVFTIPDYRRKNIGRATLAYALQECRKRNAKIATLTCIGDNISAIAMYLGMGYEVMDHQIEMHFTL